MSLNILILAIITACGNMNDSGKVTETELQGPIIETSETEQGMLIGKFTKEDLMQEPYASWFNSGYENFEPSDDAMETIKENISEYEITAFMGTWCGDSRREIPKLYKVLDEAGFDLSKLTIIGVDRSKTTPENLEEGLDINRVPTIIFTRDGKEVNRFVEYAKESIEEDIAKIVSEEEYSNAYAN